MKPSDPSGAEKRRKKEEKQTFTSKLQKVTSFFTAPAAAASSSNPPPAQPTWTPEEAPSCANEQNETGMCCESSPASSTVLAEHDPALWPKQLSDSARCSIVERGALQGAIRGLAQGHFDMEHGAAWTRTTNLVLPSTPSLTPAPRRPQDLMNEDGHRITSGNYMQMKNGERLCRSWLVYSEKRAPCLPLPWAPNFLNLPLHMVEKH